MLDALYLSPHLDDAVLSCGGRIAAAAARGERVLVATLFTADEPVEAPSPLAADLRRWWRLPAGEVMKARRAEDEIAVRSLGAEPLHLGLAEAPYRFSPDGAPLYPSLASLYGRLAAQDEPAIAAAAARIGELPSARWVAVPLGVGGHVDHLAVRRAAEASGRELAYYEEFPYSEWKWFAIRRALGERSSWAAEVLPLSPELVERRLRAIQAYASQVPSMFRTEARLRKQLRRQLRRAGGERLWRRRPVP